VAAREPTVWSLKRGNLSYRSSCTKKGPESDNVDAYTEEQEASTV
jgi:hypothetical protein